MDKLFQPITINGMTLKNRIVMPPLHHLYTPDGVMTDRFAQYYYKRAEGGAGLIMIGGCRVDEFGGATMMLDVTKPSFVEDCKVFTEEMHKRGAKVGVQLYQSGRYAKKADNVKTLAPSAVFSKFTRETADEMTREEIDLVIERLATAAKRVKEAGFDTLEILASAGYLICQFLSPLTNKRTDEFGGSWENRCRFPVMAIKAVREAVGPDFPVMIRVAGNDFVPGSNDNTDAVNFAKVAEAAGVDLIDVTGGWHETVVPQLPGDLPHGGFAYLAGAIKAAVNVPVISSNRYNDITSAKKVLAMGMADLVGFGRPLIADPDLPKKVMAGREDLVRNCIGCNQGCLARTFFSRPIECTVNAYAGYETQLIKKPAEKAKKVLIIGAGPAGLTAAIELKERGHDVEVWEKSNKAGGQLSLAATPPGKADFNMLTKYLTNMSAEIGVRVVYNKAADKASVLAYGADEVLIATGSIPATIDFPGNKEGVEIVSAVDVLEQKAFPGKNVVIIGGGSVGCEVAQYLAEESTISPELLYFLSIHQAEKPEKISSLLNTPNRNISIVEMQKKIGAGFDLGTGWPVLKQLSRLGVKSYTLSKVKEISDGAVVIEDAEGNESKIPAETVIISVGYRSVNSLYDELKDSVSVRIIGDAQKPSKVLTVVADATKTALEI